MDRSAVFIRSSSVDENEWQYSEPVSRWQSSMYRTKGDRIVHLTASSPQHLPDVGIRPRNCDAEDTKRIMTRLQFKVTTNTTITSQFPRVSWLTPNRLNETIKE